MRYFRATWKSDDPEDPRILLYEVSEDDKVRRTVDIFHDGRAQRDSVDWHARETLKGFDSLVEGAFVSRLPGPGDPVFTCSEIGRAEFEAEWDRPDR